MRNTYMLTILHRFFFRKKFTSPREEASYAPLLLFAYNRAKHTKKTLRALAANKLADKTHLFIYVDGPRNAADKAAVDSVRKLCSAATGFASVNIYESAGHKGLAESIISGVTEQTAVHGRVIVLEDDLVTSPNFLLYMNSALDHYENDSAAFSIGGYSFPPHSGFTLPEAYSWDTYSINRCCSWGWGTWHSRWKRVVWDKKYFTGFFQDASKQEAFNRSGPYKPAMLRLYCEGRLDVWAIRFCYAHFVNNMNCIYPARSLVNNIGLDGSGTHCGQDPRRQHEELDDLWLPRYFCPANQVEPEILGQFRAMFV
jgi:hypothetical protein